MIVPFPDSALSSSFHNGGPGGSGTIKSKLLEVYSPRIFPVREPTVDDGLGLLRTTRVTSVNWH